MLLTCDPTSQTDADGHAPSKSLGNDYHVHALKKQKVPFQRYDNELSDKEMCDNELCYDRALSHWRIETPR
jgi:hypothetical protein